MGIALPAGQWQVPHASNRPGDPAVFYPDAKTHTQVCMHTHARANPFHSLVFAAWSAALHSAVFSAGADSLPSHVSLARRHIGLDPGGEAKQRPARFGPGVSGHLVLIDAAANKAQIRSSGSWRANLAASLLESIPDTGRGEVRAGLPAWLSGPLPRKNAGISAALSKSVPRLCRLPRSSRRVPSWDHLLSFFHSLHHGLQKDRHK